MKNKITIFFAIIFSSFFLAQTSDQKKIFEDAVGFMKYTESKDYDKILDLTHPALFEKMDREIIKNSFKAIFEGNDDFSLQLLTKEAEGFEVSEVYKQGNTKYAFVTHPTHIIMSFKNKISDPTHQKMMVDMMEAQGMKAKFINDSSIEMTKQSMMLALNDASTKNTWKYLNYDESNYLYLSIVPEEIMKKAKSYYADFLIKKKENAN